jgi:hypothetical protein
MEVVSVYYDTRKLNLHNHGVTLSLRRDGDRYLRTVKSGSVDTQNPESQARHILAPLYVVDFTGPFGIWERSMRLPLHGFRARPLILLDVDIGLIGLLSTTCGCRSPKVPPGGTFPKRTVNTGNFFSVFHLYKMGRA